MLRIFETMPQFQTFYLGVGDFLRLTDHAKYFVLLTSPITNRSHKNQESSVQRGGYGFGFFWGFWAPGFWVFPGFLGFWASGFQGFSGFLGPWVLGVFWVLRPLGFGVFGPLGFWAPGFWVFPGFLGFWASGFPGFSGSLGPWVLGFSWVLGFLGLWVLGFFWVSGFLSLWFLGFPSLWVSVVGKHHPDIYTAIGEIQKEQGYTEVCITELAMGKKVKAAPTKKWNELQRRLEAIAAEYNRPTLEYLRAIGANVNIS